MRKSGKPQSVGHRPQTNFAKIKPANMPSPLRRSRWPTRSRRYSPARAAEIRDNNGRREPPRGETRIEKVPFSCELAFSRIISKGNFSTRCIAAIDADVRVATAESSNKSR